MREIFNQFDQEIEWNGRTITANIIIYINVDDYYDASDDDEETIEKLADGTLSVCIVECVAQWEGVTGLDILGGVIAGSQQDIQETVAYYNMVNNALVELKTELSQLKEKLA